MSDMSASGTEPLNGARRRSLALACGAFVLYGSWAFVVNVAHGSGAGVKASLTQGLSSFISTFTITMVMEAVYGTRGAPVLRTVRAFAAGSAVAWTLTVGLHLAMGTPELLATVGPVLALAAVYCAIYSVNLGRLRSATA